MLLTQKWCDRMVMVGLLIGNFFYSIAKKSLSSSIPQLKMTLNVSKQDLGDMSSDFSLAYGVSKLVGGAFSDLLPPYVLYTVGLFLGAVANLAITAVTGIKAIGYLWMLNGLGQGVGGPALSRVVVDLFPANVRSTVWSNLTFACNLGYLMAPALLGPYTDTWQGPFLVTGLGSLLSASIMGVNYMLFFRNAGANSDASDSGATRDDVCNASESAVETSTASKLTDESTAASVDPSTTATTVRSDCVVDGASPVDSLTEAAVDKDMTTLLQEPQAAAPAQDTVSAAASPPLAVPAVPVPPTSAPAPPPVSLLNMITKSTLLFAANFLAYFISKAISDWTALYLMEYMQYKEGPRMQVMEIVLWSEVGGIVGSILVGKLADFMHNRKSLACAIFTIVCIFGLWSLALHTPHYINSTIPEGSVYYSSYTHAEHGTHGADGSIVNAIVPVAATVPVPDHDTCVDPSAFDSELCKSIDADNIVHPLKQCQSVLLGTIHVMFPRADSSTLLLNQYASYAGEAISTYLTYITVDPYVTMRVVLFIIGFGINGPKTLVALELMELLPKHLCGTLTGVAGLIAQVGAACAGTYIAHTILQEGWCTFVALLTVASVLLSGILFLSAAL